MQRLTVGQLIEQLQAFPPEALVGTEGCDCNGLVGGVASVPRQDWMDADDPEVLIYRPDGHWMDEEYKRRADAGFRR